MDLNPKYDNYDFPIKGPEKQDGHPGYLTEDQIAKLHQFRMMLESEGVTDRLDTLTLVRDIAPRTLKKGRVNLREMRRHGL